MPRHENGLPETELHKLIRYGLNFEVERQMLEAAELRHENKALRIVAKKKRKLENRRKSRKRKRRSGS